MLHFLRNLQKQESNEMVQMRGIIHGKFNEDFSSIAKEREKSKALFHEMVRIGEQQEIRRPKER
mgnify:CR=1 FL=1